MDLLKSKPGQTVILGQGDDAQEFVVLDGEGMENERVKRLIEYHEASGVVFLRKPNGKVVFCVLTFPDGRLAPPKSTKDRLTKEQIIRSKKQAADYMGQSPRPIEQTTNLTPGQGVALRAEQVTSEVEEAFTFEDPLGEVPPREITLETAKAILGGGAPQRLMRLVDGQAATDWYLSDVPQNWVKMSRQLVEKTSE